MTGLRAAGPDFTRQKVIDAIHQMTDSTAQGLLAGIDWRIAHSQEPPEGCVVISKIVDGGFKPQFGTASKPFVCFKTNAAKLPKNPALKA